ncbi:MAG TPA: type II secretion system F family protein [Glaciibacter sp.]|nr:type II secretion system F family protein [Glaciibacter sp.]
MSIVLGCVLAAGLLLVSSPILWPARVSAFSARPGIGLRLRARLTQAGLGSVPLPVFAAVCMVCSIGMAALAEALFGVRPLTVVAGMAGMALPAVLVSLRAHVQRRSNRTVWPDVVDHLVSAVRSGIALPDGVSALAHAGPPSTRSAFAAFESEYRATGNFSNSLDLLKDALADPTADRILETLRMAREVGGSDLTIVLRNLAAWLRQDLAIRQEMEARQSWITNAAKLGVAAPWVVLLLLASRREAALAYNTPTGHLVILGGLLVSVVAYRVMIAVGKLRDEPRWFQ